MKPLILLILITATAKLYGQLSYDKSNVSAATEKIVSKIEQVNEVMGSAVGIAGVKPEQFDNFTHLKDTASKEELQALTNHPNAVVRCYAFWALAYDSSTDLFSIITNHISDSELVSTQFGCIGDSDRVGDFYIRIGTPNYVNANIKKLDSVQLTKLDSILIYRPNNLDAKADAIGRAHPTEELYPRIRELVTKNNDQAALVVLAKYQKKQDVSLILKNREASNIEGGGYFFTYKAISQFPHPVFLPFLENSLRKTFGDTHYSSEWNELYSAIASYKNEKALELLKLPFTDVKHKEIKTYHMSFIFGAVSKYRTPIYDDLLWTLWADEKMIDADVFKYLFRKDSLRAIVLAKKNLMNADLFYRDELSNNPYTSDTSENLTTLMLRIVLRADRAYGYEIIRRNILYGDVFLFPLFADKAVTIKDSSFIVPLFNRLGKESNPYVYLKAAEALIAYNDPFINKQILAIRKKNSELNKGWGGADFDKLLQEHNIK